MPANAEGESLSRKSTISFKSSIQVYLKTYLDLPIFRDLPKGKRPFGEMVSQNFRRSLTEFHRISTNLKEIRSVSPNFTEWLCLCASENPHSSFWQTKWTCRPITHYGKLVRIGQWPALGEGFTLSSASSWRLLNRVGAQVDYTIFNLEHFNKANWLPTAWELATISFQRNCQGSSSEELQTQNFRLGTSGSRLQTIKEAQSNAVGH